METLKYAYQSQTLVEKEAKLEAETNQEQQTNQNHSIKGYVYGLIYTLLDCTSYIILKMAPTLNGFNNGSSRYIIQFIFFGLLIKAKNLTPVPETEFRNLLIARAVSGSFALVTGFLSVQFITVADAQTLLNSSVLITALMGRFFLKEKITISHITALIVTILGVVFILRPTFLFGVEQNFENIFHLNITEHNTNITSDVNPTDSWNIYTGSTGQVIGVALILTNAFLLSVSQVTTRSLANSKVHHSLIGFYPCLFGLPISVIGSVVLYFISPNLDSLTTADVLYSCSCGLIGVVSLIFLNKAMQYEDAAKISMLRISGVLFSMIFQYFILDIEIDFLGVIGSILVVVGTFIIVFIKLFSQGILNSGKCYRVIAVEF